MARPLCHKILQTNEGLTEIDQLTDIIHNQTNIELSLVIQRGWNAPGGTVNFSQNEDAQRITI